MNPAFSSQTSKNIAYLNGRIIPEADAALPVTDLGMQGLAITEMLRTFGNQVFCFDAHFQRLSQSAQYVGFELPFDQESLSLIIQGLVQQNRKTISESQDLGIVIFVTAGANPTYLGASASLFDEGVNRYVNTNGCTVGIHTFPLPLKNWKQAWQEGVHLVVPPTTQVPASILNPQIKSRSRLHWHLADRQAKEIASDARAILLNEQGYLTETSAANFFLVQQGVIRTPRKETVLEGISRQVVFDLAEQLGIPIEEADLTPSDLENCDEAFLSSTPYCLLPVTQFQNVAIPISDTASKTNSKQTGQPGETFHRLIDAWSQLLNHDIHRQMLNL